MQGKLVYQLEGCIKDQRTPKVVVALPWSEMPEEMTDVLRIPFYDKTSGIACSYPIETRRQRETINGLLQQPANWDEAEIWVLHERVENR